MRNEIVFYSSLEITFIAGEGLFSSVCSGMRSEVGLLSTLEITLITGEGLFSSV